MTGYDANRHADAGDEHRFELLMSVVVVGVVIAAILVAIGAIRGSGAPPPTPSGASSQSGMTPEVTTPGPTSTPPATTDTRTTGTTTSSSTPTQTTSGPAAKPKDSSVAVLSSGWQPGDDTYHFDNTGVPEFDGPPKWGCMTMGKGDLGIFHVTCINDGGTFPIRPTGSGGNIYVFDCEDRCTVAQARDKVASLSKFIDPGKQTDDFVTASQTAPADDGPDLVKLVLATVWERPSGDKIVLVTIDTLPEEVPDVQNMITSIYESAR
jgi:hypothetical protein